MLQAPWPQKSNFIKSDKMLAQKFKRRYNFKIVKLAGMNTMSLTPSIYSMFGSSPITPLENHIDKVCACVKLLPGFFEAVRDEDWTIASELQAHISKLEHEADELKKDLRLNLPKGLFMPFSRSDVLNLLTEQDRLANIAEDIAGIIIGRHMHLPSALQEPYMIFLHQCIKACLQAQTAINELDELLETGFRGNEVNIVNNMVNKLNDIEHETDTMQVSIRATLFELESGLHPVDVMFLYKVIQWTGDLADRAQSVGSKLQILISR